MLISTRKRLDLAALETLAQAMGQGHPVNFSKAFSSPAMEAARMEDVFHGIKIDKVQLAKVKELSKQKKTVASSGKKAALVETEDFIPFTFSDPEEDVKEEEPVSKVKVAESSKEAKVSKDSKTDTKKGYGKKEPSAAPQSKRLRIDTLLHKDMPWLDKRRKYSSITAVRLHEEIVDFINWMSPTEEERYARQACIQRVKDVVAKQWPGAVVEAYGSVRTQFYVPSSDIDLVVLLEDEDAKLPLKKMAHLLSKADVPEEGSVQVIAKARVPIIKYLDKITSYPVDISFNVTSGTESGDLVSKYSGQYPALRPLTLLLKQFLEMRGLNEVYTGGIGSYTVTCLVLSFLQTHPLIQTGIIRPHENLGVMLLDMLELYGRHFNYEAAGISVAPEFKGEFYFDKAERGWVNDNRPASLSIEDPQQPDNDISKGSFSFNFVRQSFEHGFNVLVAAMTEYEHVLLDRYKTKVNPSELSILGSIIRIQDTVLRHRHYVQSTTNL